MLQFHLLKYLKFDDLIKINITCKNGGKLFDSNLCNIYLREKLNESTKTIKKNLKKFQKNEETRQHFLMIIISL